MRRYNPAGHTRLHPSHDQRLVKTRLPWFLKCSRLLCGAAGPRHPTGLFPPACLGCLPSSLCCQEQCPPEPPCSGTDQFNQGHAASRRGAAGGVTSLTWQSLWTSFGVRGRRSGALRCALSPGAVPETAWRSGRPSGSGCSCLGAPRGDEHRCRAETGGASELGPVTGRRPESLQGPPEVESAEPKWGHTQPWDTQTESLEQLAPRAVLGLCGAHQGPWG